MGLCRVSVSYQKGSRQLGHLKCGKSNLEVSKSVTGDTECSVFNIHIELIESMQR
jgi:hypothetical protein